MFTYLNDIGKLLSQSSGAKTAAEFSHVDHLQEALAVRSAYVIKDVMTRFASSKDNKKVKTNEKFGVDLINMSRAHMIYLSF